MTLNILKNSIKKGMVTLPIGCYKMPYLPEIEEIRDDLKRMVFAKFGRSFHIREVDTASCGACESEIISCLNPMYDIQRFGIDFVASPRHADALLVTGAVSKNMEIALLKTYESMPTPKFVITLGDCAFDAGVFKESYYILKRVKDILPVSLHIPGCPPNPHTIIRFLAAFLQKTV